MILLVFSLVLDFRSKASFSLFMSTHRYEMDSNIYNAMKYSWQMKEILWMYMMSGILFKYYTFSMNLND